MANQQLYNKAYFSIPDNVLKDINAALQKYGTSNGSERAMNLVRSPKLSYSLAKKIKNFFDNYSSHNGNQATFELYGGKGMANWLNTVLGGSRNAIERTKTNKSNGGMDNQFIKNHEKSALKPTKLEVGDTMMPKTKRLQLFEVKGSEDMENVAAICVVFNPKGEFLVVKRIETDDWMPNKWALVGGGVKVSEEINDAVSREIKEETNLDVKGVKYSFSTMEDDTKIYIFMAKCSEPERIIVDEKEHSDYKWVTLENCDEIETVPHLKEYVIKALKLFKKEKPTD
jgi:8-oxo-dGTP diphosphatase